MNRILYKIKTNFFPFIIAVALFFACAMAWYLYHPSSPYHKRYTFVVRYEAIGTLSPGNRVEIRGVSKGQILKVELTEDAVFVTAEVLEDAKIPRNSEFRLITSGLMGEREMCVLSGDSKDYILDGDTVNGIYDKGTSGISKDLFAAFESIQIIKKDVVFLVDSLTIGTSGKRIERVSKKRKNLIKNTKNSIISWKQDLENVLDKFEVSLNKTISLTELVAQRGDNSAENIKSMVNKLDSLLVKVQNLKKEVNELSSKLEQEDNTLGLIMSEKGRIINELDALIRDVDALTIDIKKQGLKLNVDIF